MKPYLIFKASFKHESLAWLWIGRTFLVILSRRGKNEPTCGGLYTRDARIHVSLGEDDHFHAKISFDCYVGEKRENRYASME